LSAPSELHETLRGDLLTAAILAGYPLHLPLEAALIPDIVRTDFLRSAVFIGDAKATETPSNAATGARLTAYARMVAGWCSVGLDLRVAIAHRDATSDWRDLLERSCREAGLMTSGARCDVLLGTTASVGPGATA
jgi:hypothetical protein